MIAIEAMPCSNCVNYDDVRQPDGTELTEYIRCKVAKDKNARFLLELRNGRVFCNKQSKEYDE